MADYTLKLKQDLVEQFKDLPNLNALMEVFGEQFQDLADFYESLRTQRNMDNAIGKQLDGVGDIVVLSRAEAGNLASFPSPDTVLDDELYRKFLRYKAFKNTNNTTYSDILRSFSMFWDKPLYYSEDPSEPATMIFTTGILSPEDGAEKLLTAPIIRAAGVGMRVIAITETPEMNRQLHFTTIMGQGQMITQLPVIEPDFDFSTTERVTGIMGRGQSITQLPTLEPSYELSTLERVTTIAGNIIETVLPELKEETTA